MDLKTQEKLTVRQWCARCANSEKSDPWLCLQCLFERFYNVETHSLPDFVEKTEDDKCVTGNST